MARQTEIIEHLLDDVDGTSAAETITFSVDGTTYEIDLNKRNAKALRADLAKWARYARKVKPARRRTRRPRNADKALTDSATIRAWAAKRGIEVSSRGRIPASVIERYRKS